MHNSNSKLQHHVHVDTHPPTPFPLPEGKKKTISGAAIEAVLDKPLSLLCGLLSPDVTLRTDDS